MTTPDYTKYSLSELQEALAIVDGRQYPENKAAIEAEIQARRDSGAYEQEEQAQAEALAAKEQSRVDFARAARPIIAWYLVGCGVLVLGAQFVFRPVIDGVPGMVIFGTGCLYMLATIVAGAGLIKARKWGVPLAVGALALQVLQIQSATINFQALSAFAFYLTLAGDGTIGVSASFSPGFTVHLGSGSPFFLGLNVFAVWLIYLLLKADQQAQTLPED